MKSLVSVIIPIYNVEQYLEKCLDSVINQTYKDLEIVCVNDCSSDNSLDILQEYVQFDNRIKIINFEQNKGVSAARNAGLEMAKGEYVYFIDSDDWIDLDYIEKMVSAITFSKTDVVVNTNVIQEFENKPSKKLVFGDLEIEENAFVDADNAINNIMWASWAQLWDRKFLERNHLRFLDGHIYEDMHFPPVAYSYMDKIYAIAASAYHYRIRENSLCRQNEDDYSVKEKLLFVYNTVFDFFVKTNYIENHRVRLFPKDFILPALQNNNDKIYELLLTYLVKIKKYVERDKELYDKVDYEFFTDIIQNIDLAKSKNYYAKKRINNTLTLLKKNIKNKS